MLMKVFFFVHGIDSVLFPIPHYWSVFYLLITHAKTHPKATFFMAAKKERLHVQYCVMYV